ncbi:hypothetical protein MGN70_007792 [Eutypa lata]|nr:hypothetical protein MGN70_007792 [Eutypa lata]
MASDGKQSAPSRPRPLLNAAIRKNSIPTLQSALTAARAVSSPSAYSDFLDTALSTVISRGSAPLTRYLLSQGNAAVSNVSALAAANSPSVELFEALLENGWDVNHRDPSDTVHRARQLIDYVLDNEELVRWLVDHGVRVDREVEVEEDPEGLHEWPQPILESCALIGSLSTLKFLLVNGAKISRRTLHRAAEAGARMGANPATKHPETAGGGARRRQEKAQILQYLVDELNVDVNQMDTDVLRGWMHFGTPVNYAAKEQMGAGVVNWLLAKGADPRIKSVQEDGKAMDAEDYAQSYSCEESLEVIRRWKRDHEQ